MISFDNHPILVTRELIRRFGPNLLFSFSKYRIGRPGFQAQMERSVCTVQGSELTDSWLQEQIERLPIGFELALQSNVFLSDVTYQIPMIDFATDNEKEVWAFSKNIDSYFWCFHTGRSFHGYCAELVTHQTWLDFLGGLLLAPRHNQAEAIDVRWVGHALQRGFSALRWSRQTERYASLPSLCFVHEASSGEHETKLA